MIQKTNKMIQAILVQSGILPQDKLEIALKSANAKGQSLADFLVLENILQEKQLLELYAKHSYTSFVDLKKIDVDKDLLRKIPVKFVWYYKFFPVELKNRKLTVAVSRLLDVNTSDEIRFGLGYELETVFATAKDIDDALTQYYGVGADTVDSLVKRKPADKRGADVESFSQQKEEDIGDLAENASVVQLVNRIILEAYRKGASDIHIEPSRQRVRLRYRIDGRLQETRVPDEMNQFLQPILSRIKIMANLNIVERRMPQDGKARVKIQDQVLNLRISSLPTPHGESIVIRILPTTMITSLDDLGFNPTNRKQFEELIRRPYGIFFVTGPTGSGKSTTLYAGLNSINSFDKKIVTLEDPVEYEMPDMIQMQVMPEIGLTFAIGLRSILRHDPDVMMVGEVRDFETADVAIRVALTGHLILSTLHTNDAASGVTRLLDIGVEPYLIASSVNGFMAQRLLRVICPHCKEENPNVIPEVLSMIRQDLKLDKSQQIKIYKGAGCDKCSGSGYLGRVAIHEMLIIDDDVRRLIVSQAPAEEIKKKAIQAGMQSLRQDGWQKVISGLTTESEVLQVTPPDKTSAAKNTLRGEAETDYIVLPQGKDALKQDSGASQRERRKYIRVRVQLDVIFREIAIDGDLSEDEAPAVTNEESAESENISAGGVAFHTSKQLYVGDIIEMKIDLFDGQTPIDCIGRVLRVSETKNENDEPVYHAGIIFLAIHSSDRARIEKFCEGKTQV